MKAAPDDLVASALRRLGPPSRGRLAAAVSGGSDSMSLLAIASPWCKQLEITLEIVSIDHQLRSAAASECRMVGDYAKTLGHRHTILTWEQSDCQGNLQQEARRARYALISGWAKARGIHCVALGHTRDDQAETVLLNLARGSGVYGLAAMPEKLERHGTDWIRPLLNVRRKALRSLLRKRGISWIEDPSNDNRKFDRVRMRKILPKLDEAGLTVEALARSAAHMQRARQVLADQVVTAARHLVSVTPLGEITIKAGFWAQPDESRYRLLAAVVRFQAGEEHGRRLSAVVNCLRALHRDGASTIASSVLILDRNRGIRVIRDYRRCGPEVSPDCVWDGRWQFVAPQDVSGCHVGALGNCGIRQNSGHSVSAPDGRALLAGPALWCGDKVVASIAGCAADRQKFRLLADRSALLDFLRRI